MSADLERHGVELETKAGATTDPILAEELLFKSCLCRFLLTLRLSDLKGIVAAAGSAEHGEGWEEISPSEHLQERIREIYCDSVDSTKEHTRDADALFRLISREWIQMRHRWMQLMAMKRRNERAQPAQLQQPQPRQESQPPTRAKGAPNPPQHIFRSAGVPQKSGGPGHAAARTPREVGVVRAPAPVGPGRDEHADVEVRGNAQRSQVDPRAVSAVCEAAAAKSPRRAPSLSHAIMDSSFITPRHRTSGVGVQCQASGAIPSAARRADGRREDEVGARQSLSAKGGAKIKAIPITHASLTPSSEGIFTQQYPPPPAAAVAAEEVRSAGCQHRGTHLLTRLPRISNAKIACSSTFLPPQESTQ
jgi:hypothetical protein